MNCLSKVFLFGLCLSVWASPAYAQWPSAALTVGEQETFFAESEEVDADAQCTHYLQQANYWCASQNYDERLCVYFEARVLDWCQKVELESLAASFIEEESLVIKR